MTAGFDDRQYWPRSSGVVNGEGQDHELAPVTF